MLTDLEQHMLFVLVSKGCE